MNIAITYAITLVIFAIIDTVWLGTMADRIYRPLIGSMLADNFRLVPAMVFYCMYAGALTVFAVMPGLNADDWKKALTWGALFGLFAYATYDLTNLATLKSWSTKLVVIDITWGVVVSAASSSLACLMALKLLK